MTPKVLEVAELIERTARGDHRAFTRLYETTHVKLLSVIRRVLRNGDDADDALQEIYLKVWRSAGRYARGGSPISWLSAIARNHALDVVRAKTLQTANIDAFVHLADPMPTPEAATLAHERLLQMEWSIAKLKQKAGSLVRDAYQLGYSYEEVALRHGVPLNTVRTSLRRSLAQLTVHGLAFEAA